MASVIRCLWTSSRKQEACICASVKRIYSVTSQQARKQQERKKERKRPSQKRQSQDRNNNYIKKNFKDIKKVKLKFKNGKEKRESRSHKRNLIIQLGIKEGKKIPSQDRKKNFKTLTKTLLILIDRTVFLQFVNK